MARKLPALSWPCESHRLMLGGLAYGALERQHNGRLSAEAAVDDMTRNLIRWLETCSACQQLREEAAA